MSEQHFHYDEMVQEALLGVVRKVLQDTAQNGLPGDHHFYIAFSTEDPGVSIPDHLRERYKDEMTIVLQNQFWDLKVEDDYFEVGLSFNSKPALLRIPFDAVTGFLDPSVEFGLQFQRSEDETEVEDLAPEETVEEDAAKPETGDTDDEANVVTLDAFRKKK
jgi:hypothetical protein